MENNLKIIKCSEFKKIESGNNDSESKVLHPMSVMNS